MPMAERPPDPYRDLLADDVDICFTHGDLNLRNIMIDGAPGAVKISAIIDWEQAGWYPAYWEYCKSLIAVPYDHEWRDSGWSDTVMYRYEDEWIAFSEYWMWRQP
jgi:thiamine kinase-like enzyme